MDISLSGPFDIEQVDQFLSEGKVPIRLSCVATDGFPRVVSLWYQYRQEMLYCVTHQASSLLRILEKNNRVGFEIAADAPPYVGVRGQGSVTLQALGSDPALEQLLTRYLGNLESDFSRWLLSRSDEEVLIAVRPHRIYSWDYRERMAGVA